MPDISKRILIFTTAYKPLAGGSEIAIEQVTRRLPDAFFDILTPRHKKDFPAAETDGQNTTIHRLGFGFGLDKYFFPILGFFKGWSFLRYRDEKIVHAFQASHSAGAAYLLKLFFPNIRFILTIQEGKDLEKQNFLIRFLRKLILKKADRVTVISNYLKDYVISQGVKENKVVLIPNGVDIEEFNTNIIPEPRENLNVSENHKVIISTSRLVPKNGLSGLIDAIPYIKAEASKPVKLIIIGSGPLKSELEKKIIDKGLSGKVEILDEKKHTELPRFLRTADVFVRPSLSEGLGNSFLEAMAVGLPVIGTTKIAGVVKTGIADFIKEGETGLSCNPNDSKDIADKINLILKDGALANRLSKNGRDLIVRKYNWQTIKDQYKEIYEKAK